jgi:hypothetical protein
MTLIEVNVKEKGPPSSSLAAHVIERTGRPRVAYSLTLCTPDYSRFVKKNPHVFATASPNKIPCYLFNIAIITTLGGGFQPQPNSGICSYRNLGVETLPTRRCNMLTENKAQVYLRALCKPDAKSQRAVFSGHGLPSTDGNSMPRITAIKPGESLSPDS